MAEAVFEIQLLGGLRIGTKDGPSVDMPLNLAGAILAYLALNQNCPHTREKLADIFWPDEDSETGRHRLRQRLHALRQQLQGISPTLADALIASRSDVQLDSGIIRTDVRSFEEAIVNAGSQTQDRERVRLVEQAIGYYKGDLTPGLYYECFTADRLRLSHAFQGALHDLSLAYEATGDLERAIETARRLVTLDPLNEESHCALMRLYAAKGQPSAVLRQYQTLERVLEDEVGEKPAAKTQELMETLREAGHSRIGDCLAFRPRPAESQSVSPQLAHRWRAADARNWIGGALALIALTGWMFVLPHRASDRKNAVPKASPAGPVWSYEFALMPGDKDSDVTAMASDDKGQIYVAGFVNTQRNDVDFLTLKLDIFGKLIWQQRFNGTGNDVDRLRAIVVDYEGNVYVTGESDSGKGNGPRKLRGLDIVTIKYNAAGKRQWLDSYNDIDDSEDRPVALGLDSQGDVYVLGNCSRVRNLMDAGSDMVLLRYDRQGGKRRWVRRFDGPDHLDDVPTSLSIGSDFAAICGYSRAVAASGPEYDYLTLRYSPDGRLLWQRRFGAGNRSDDYARFVGGLHDGAIISVGEAKCPPGWPYTGHRGYVAVKYDSLGRQVWTRGADSPADQVEEVSTAFISPSGNTLSAGPALDARGARVYRAVVRDISGVPARIQDCPGSGLWDANKPAAAVWGPHTSWLAGNVQRQPDAQESDFMVALLSPTGGITVKQSLQRPRGSAYVRAAISGDCGWGNSVVVGGQVEVNSKRSIIVVRYAR